MTIIEKIKQSVEGATGMPFLYHAAGELNELIARCGELPVAYSFLIDSGTIDDVNGRYHERVTLAVMFCDKTEFDFNALENEEIIDRMKVKAYKWMQSLRMSNTLRVVSVNNTQRLYDNTTDILTGFAVNITIEDVSGVGECELPQVVIDVDKNGSYDVVGVDRVRVNVVPKLEELEITENGEYLPPTDIAGFSKVVANVLPKTTDLVATENDKEYLPADYGVDAFGKVKTELRNLVKVFTFRITNDCINEEGRWEGDTLIDTSNIISLNNAFSECSLLKELDVRDWDVSNVEDMHGMFNFCTSLKYIDVSNWDTSKVMNFFYMFAWSRGMDVKGLENFDTSSAIKVSQMFVGGLTTKVVDFTNWDFSNITNANNFADGWEATSLVGGRTLEDVISNDIKVFKNLKVSTRYLWDTKNIDSASLVAIINGLADLTGQTAQTLAFSSIIGTKLDAEQIAGMPAKDYLAGKASAKNWTISY